MDDSSYFHLSIVLFNLTYSLIKLLMGKVDNYLFGN